jgi:hypothetical protein
MKVHHTPIGDLIVLPPQRCEGTKHCRCACHEPVLNGLAAHAVRGGKCPGWVPAVGDVVDGDIGCPTCEGRTPSFCSGVCGGSGTVSVPHEVVAVVPLVANFEGATMPNAVLLVTETGVEWWGRGDNEAHYLANLVLPDVEPGGICLIVERAT